MKMKKVCVVTGTRAEYGLLKPLLCRIQENADTELCLIVTGMHLSPEYGLTYQEIENDGFMFYEKNEMLLSSDTVNGISKSVGLGIVGFADIYTRVRPDMVVILGDRFEIFAAASAAMLQGIAIAHIHGGELTEGAVDDSIRHAITKMSTLHFTSTVPYQKRVIQMGEQPQNVHCVGALGIENIKNQKLMNKEELESSIQFSLAEPFVLVTYHPVTLEKKSAKKQFEMLLEILSELPYHVIFTKANADAEGKVINYLIDEYVGKHIGTTIAFTSMGLIRYLSTLKLCRMVIGNSSSGIIEAPSFHIPTINIGNRQKGRVRAASVIDCENNKQDILRGIEIAEQMYQKNMLKDIANPYEGRDTSKEIFDKIVDYINCDNKKTKKFYDINNEIYTGE